MKSIKVSMKVNSKNICMRQRWILREEELRDEFQLCKALQVGGCVKYTLFQHF